MYMSLIRRQAELLQHIQYQFVHMALDPRLMPGVAAEMRAVRSTASTPTLRSREGSVTPGGGGDKGGNVRVVVRVRGFLHRGMARSQFG